MTLQHFIDVMHAEGGSLIVTVGGAASVGATLADGPGALYGCGVGVVLFILDHRHRSTS